MSLATWVSDELHDVTGMSDRNLAGETLYSWHFKSRITTTLNVINYYLDGLDFFIGLAKKSKSADGLIEKIRETEALDINDRVKTFAKQLYDR